MCHSLKENWGENQAEIIREFFDKISVNGEPIATIAIGTGLVGMLSGADYTLDAIINFYNEEKEVKEYLKLKKDIDRLKILLFA